MKRQRETSAVIIFQWIGCEIVYNKKQWPQRRSTRLKNYDYSEAGAYFITICTAGRRPILSRVVGGGVPAAPQSIALLPYGEIAEKYVRQLNDFYDHITVESYVIMPNHIHMMILVQEGGAPGTSPPTGREENGAPGTSPPTGREENGAPGRRLSVPQFVSTLKRFCNKECGENIWQRSFNDHIIRNREDYEGHLRYILENPARWGSDELFAEQ